MPQLQYGAPISDPARPEPGTLHAGAETRIPLRA